MMMMMSWLAVDSYLLTRPQNTYAGFLNYSNAHVRDLNVPGDACSFNAGVFVADLAVWRLQNVTARLEYWCTLNTRYGDGQYTRSFYNNNTIANRYLAAAKPGELHSRPS